jgi:hypothetical protein
MVCVLGRPIDGAWTGAGLFPRGVSWERGGAEEAGPIENRNGILMGSEREADEAFGHRGRKHSKALMAQSSRPPLRSFLAVQESQGVWDCLPPLEGDQDWALVLEKAE